MPDSVQDANWRLRIRFAASYLDMLLATGRRRAFLISAYGIGDMGNWCSVRIRGVLSGARKIAKKHRLSPDSITVVQGEIGRLAEHGFRVRLS